jgi:uncharacterized protein (DUF433 family)
LRLVHDPAIMLTMKTAPIISDPDILDGPPVFADTRVPVRNRTDCLEAGDSIAVFLDDFPTVSRARVTSAALAHV